MYIISLNYNLNNSNHFNKIIHRDLADREAKEKAETLTGIGQKMVNQKGFSQKIKEAML